MADERITITIDSRGSGGSVSHIEGVLERLNAAGLRMERPFTVTVGDEIQGLTTEPAVVTDVVEMLGRDSCWIGIGIGAVLELREESRLSGGPSGDRSRAAIERAKLQQGHGRRRIDEFGVTRSWPLAVEGEDNDLAAQVEYALGVMWRLVSERTVRQHEVALAGRHLATSSQVADELALAASTVSKLRRAAHVNEVAALRHIAISLLARTLGGAA